MRMHEVALNVYFGQL